MDHDPSLIAEMQPLHPHPEHYVAPDGSASADFVHDPGGIQVHDAQGFDVGSIHHGPGGSSFVDQTGHTALRLDHDTVYGSNGLPTEHLLHYGNTTDIYDTSGHAVGSIVRTTNGVLTFEPGFPPTLKSFG